MQELNIVANCLECRGSGKDHGSQRCRYCDRAMRYKDEGNMAEKKD